MPEDNILEIKATYDCIMGRSKHYVVGAKGRPISGGLYFKEGQEVPKQILITLVKEK